MANASYFQLETPSEYASYMYDAVMATGIGACDALMAPEESIHKGDHIGSILESRFTGASGTVSFVHDDDDDSHENIRDSKGPLYGIYNIRPAAATAGGDKRGYVQTVFSVGWYDSVVLLTYCCSLFLQVQGCAHVSF